jgi:hypothetical protein
MKKCGVFEVSCASLPHVSSRLYLRKTSDEVTYPGHFRNSHRILDPGSIQGLLVDIGQYFTGIHGGVQQSDVDRPPACAIVFALRPVCNKVVYDIFSRCNSIKTAK